MSRIDALEQRTLQQSQTQAALLDLLCDLKGQLDTVQFQLVEVTADAAGPSEEANVCTCTTGVQQTFAELEGFRADMEVGHVALKAQVEQAWASASSRLAALEGELASLHDASQSCIDKALEGVQTVPHFALEKLCVRSVSDAATAATTPQVARQGSTPLPLRQMRRETRFSRRDPSPAVHVIKPLSPQHAPRLHLAKSVPAPGFIAPPVLGSGGEQSPRVSRWAQYSGC